MSISKYQSGLNLEHQNGSQLIIIYGEDQLKEVNKDSHKVVSKMKKLPVAGLELFTSNTFQRSKSNNSID
jgi:L-arabinose isomerase